MTNKILSRWFTNIDIEIQDNRLDLTARYNKDDYPEYDNYNAINVDKVKEIPMDYDGVMGVPITFLDKYYQEQFEIVGIADRKDSYNYRTRKYTTEEYENANDLNARACILVDGKPKALYARILIKKKTETEE